MYRRCPRNGGYRKRATRWRGRSAPYAKTTSRRTKRPASSLASTPSTSTGERIALGYSKRYFKRTDGTHAFTQFVLCYLVHELSCVMTCVIGYVGLGWVGVVMQPVLHHEPETLVTTCGWEYAHRPFLVVLAKFLRLTFVELRCFFLSSRPSYMCRLLVFSSGQSIQESVRTEAPAF